MSRILVISVFWGGLLSNTAEPGQGAGRIQSLCAFRRASPQYHILPHFQASRPSANDRYGHLESNGLIGIEFGEFRQKIEKLGISATFKLLEVPGCYLDRFRSIPYHVKRFGQFRFFSFL